MLRLNIICGLWSPDVATSNISSLIVFAFHLQSGATVTCHSSPCQCNVVNATAAQLSCDYMPASYDNADLTCYLRHNLSVSVQAPVYVRGKYCSGSACAEVRRNMLILAVTWI